MTKTISAGVDVMATLRVTITDEAPEDLFTRMEGESGEAMRLYGAMDRSEVIEHWAFNAISNRIKDVSRLDGWADVPRGAVTFDFADVEVHAHD